MIIDIQIIRVVVPYVVEHVAGISKISNDAEHCTASLRQLSVLFSLLLSC